MEVVEIFVPLDESGERDASSAESAPALAARAEQALGWPRGAAGELRVVRRSLDARKKHAIGYRLRVEVARKGETLARAAARRSRRGAALAGGPPATARGRRRRRAGRDLGGVAARRGGRARRRSSSSASRCSRAAAIWRCSRGER